MSRRRRLAAALAAGAALALAQPATSAQSAAPAKAPSAAAATAPASPSAPADSIPIEIPGSQRAGRIEWQRIEEARAYRATVLDSAGATVFDGETEEPGIDLTLAPGSYKLRVAVLNKFMKQASVTPWMDISVLKAVRPVPTRLWPPSLPAGLREATIRIEGAGISKESRATLASRGVEFMGRFVELLVAEEAPRADNLRERPARAVGASFSFDLSRSNAGEYDLSVVNPGGQGTLLRAALRLAPPEAVVLPARPKTDESRSPSRGGAPREPEALLEPIAPSGPAAPSVPAASPEGAATGSRPGGRVAIEGTARASAAGPTAAADASSSAAAEAERPSREARAGRAFPRPDPRGLWLEASWGAAMFTSAGFSDRYGAALAGGSLGAIASLPRLLKVSPSLGSVGLELRLSASSFPASSRATGSSTFLAAEAGAGFALRTDLAFPLNLAARLGGALSASSVSSSSGVGSSSSLSFDPAAYLGLGARLALGRHFLELGAEWRGTFYIDQLVQRLGAGLTLGWAL